MLENFRRDAQMALDTLDARAQNAIMAKKKRKKIAAKRPRKPARRKSSNGAPDPEA
jgi:hypothetical protein